MDASKPLYLKTYGKLKRKVCAWISPVNHKRAFDSSHSTEGDVSVFEPAKPAGKRSVRHAKRKAMLYLTEKSSNEESISNEVNVAVRSPPRPKPDQQSKTTRRKRSVCSSRAVHPAKRKAMSCVTENSSDEENTSRPSPLNPQLDQQTKTTRKSQFVMVPGVLGHQVAVSNESQVDSALKCHKNSVQKKRKSKVYPPSMGRFVTHRRRAMVTKPKLPKAIVSILSSSDDFTSQAFDSSRILRPLRRKRVLSTFMVSSSDSSINAAGNSGVATNVLREISLNESADHSLGPCTRKPIFCSTPSVSSLGKQPRLKLFPQPFSCTGVLSPSQDGLDSCGQPISPPPFALSGFHSEEKTRPSDDEKKPDLHHRDEFSRDLFVNPKTSNKSSGMESFHHRADTKTKSSVELSSLNLVSTQSESSSQYVSATAGLEWLIEALKENCLTQLCTVQLERLDTLAVTQLCCPTAYSSCLEDRCSVHSQSMDSGQAVDVLHSFETSLPPHLSMTNNNSGYYLQSLNSIDSSEQAASVIDSQSSNDSLSVEYSPTRELMEQSASELYDGSIHHTENNVHLGTAAQLSANSTAQTVFTRERAVTLKNKYLAKRCTIQLQKLTPSQLNVQQLKGFRHQEEARACDEWAVNPNANRKENDYINDTEDLTCSGETTDRMMVSVKCSVNKHSAITQTQSVGPETEANAAMPKAILKEKCLTDQPTLVIKRLTLSQLKEILKLKDAKLKSPTVTSDSATGDQPKNDHQSESDPSFSLNLRNWSSTSSEDNFASNKDVVQSSRDNVYKRKKMSLAPKERKRRSTSSDRAETTRKACVSGLSMSRWKNKSNTSTNMFRSRTAQTCGTMAVDCSITELISRQHKQPENPGASMNFSTPVRSGRLNLSSLLADFTPNTHTWSRLKAALSVHRKGIVLHTPRALSGSSALADISQDLFATPSRMLLPKHLQSQLLSHDSLDEELSDAQKVYAECGQQCPLPWEACILPNRMKKCVKIGEGTFGEVFSTTNASGDTVALKIIPVEGSEKVNGEDQKTFGEILHEIIISKELSSLKEKQQNQTHSFIGLNDLHCVQGCYPPDFLDAWDRFDQQKGSENDRPDFFEKNQIFLILEFEFGGIDLESSNGTLASLGVAKSILHQITAALAVAEQELHFEHRDLHWGNVLVKTTKQKTGSFLLNEKIHSLETKGVLVRIIDYSLSRLEIDDLTVSCDISKDEELFMGEGDYQFEIYRLMRKENGNNWSEYHPHTNVLWLHYLCSKLLSMKYRGSGGRGAKDIREELTRFSDSILQYSSATDVLQNCPMFQ
ncbi:serine-rich adhesin for platelets isoform X2 [Mastacembelus armatus]|uniref:serine-rich adhesin for platelets isoform X2 n=1 Tax=Mastacembelus armatus TaxID=205130 RepID=UPI000E45CA97|nr:serine/threonine-protein kinase haspin isoform X2 [Mastacembelus armatus]